ncbi:hypothetical protein G6F43_013924 [Rhizopus delemar]|nr:hypothetical protein G6F43_013924 [Rhizopus delemar]
MTDNININEIDPQLIQQILAAYEQQRQQQEQPNVDRYATYGLPDEILQDLEESSKKELQHNVQRYQRDAVRYDGGQWTKGGAINKVFIPDYKKYNVDSHQFITNKYKDAERLRIAARGGADIFQDLQALIERGGSGEEEIRQIMEKIRRLSVYAFACTSRQPHQPRRRR